MPKEISGEIPAIDAKRVLRILAHDVAPSEEQNASSRGNLSNAWKTIEKDCGCNKGGAKLYYKLSRMTDELRDDFLRTLYTLMKAGKIGISQDLVDKMQGEDAPTMPTVDKSGGMGADNLVTLADRRPDPDAAAFNNDVSATQPAA